MEREVQSNSGRQRLEAHISASGRHHRISHSSKLSTSLMARDMGAFTKILRFLCDQVSAGPGPGNSFLVPIKAFGTSGAIPLVCLANISG